MNSKYDKRQGTSGIRGQLYETKLLSSLYFRLTHDDRIEWFHLATNVDNIGSFDDICFVVKVKDSETPCHVYIQAKSKENVKRLFSYKTDMGKNFKSYLDIRYKFEPNKKDVLFKGLFDETQCLFVMYSNANNELRDVDENSFTEILDDLIGTGGAVMKPYKTKEDVKYLCEIAIKENISELATRMVRYLKGEIYFANILSDELVMCYHVIMRQKVLDLSDILDQDQPKPKRHRMASFRQDFFESKEEYIMSFRDALYLQILRKRQIIQRDMPMLLSEFLENPLDVTALSKIVVTVVTYDNGQLQLVKRTSSTKAFHHKLQGVFVPQLTFNKAVELAAKDILTGVRFKVPVCFGNKDLTMRDKQRLEYVITKLCDLTKNSKSKLVTVDESVEKGFLKLNGGIASAVGNVLVLDEDKKYMKFTQNGGILEGLAKDLFDELNSRIDNLHDYSFHFKARKFPKLSFDCSLYEEDLARDFLNKLLFFTNQSDEGGVGERLKIEIENEQRNHVNLFLVNTDSIFMRYHEAIQAWWMTPREAPYLTKSSTILEDVMDDILKDRVMSLVTYMTNKNTKKCMNYTFADDVMKSFELQLQSQNILIADNCELLCAKVIQYLKYLKEGEREKCSSNTTTTSEKNTKRKLSRLNLEFIVLDFQYILNLSTHDCKALGDELSNISEQKLLIFVCEDIQNTEHVRKRLKSIAKAILDRNIIVITNKATMNTIQKHFIHSVNVVSDDRHSLIDLIAESKKSILKNAKVVFQGKEISLDFILDNVSISYIQGEVLTSVIRREIMMIGKSIGNQHYYKMKHMYIDRRLKTENSTDIVVRTLLDVAEDVVVVTANPGMGKSTLLTRLALKTKNIDPKAWVIRINLSEHSVDFSKWKNDTVNIDALETLKFLCQVLLREKLGETHEVQLNLEEVDGVVQLKDCTGDYWTVFELRLFLHFYNRKKVIFLFDGFDEVVSCANEVLECINTVRACPQKHKIWITSRAFNEIKYKLEREFGKIYEMSPLSYSERGKYLMKFWRSNLILKEFNTQQLDSVHEFIEYMEKSEFRNVRNFELLLHEIYANACLYLINEVTYTHLSLWKFKRNNDVNEIHNMRRFAEHVSDGTPLLLHLTADYFLSLIKQASRETFSWSLDVNTFDIYDKYLERKLKIWFEEKHEMKVGKSVVNSFYKKELEALIMQHKKLAAYAIFRLDILALFTVKELKEIKKTIKYIEREDKETGHICSVAYGIPIFAHNTFAEYYAVEYVCYMLKSQRGSDNVYLWLAFIFNVLFADGSLVDVRKLFMLKVNVDQALLTILVENKNVIFDILVEQGTSFLEYITNLRKMPPWMYARVARNVLNPCLIQWELYKMLSENICDVESLFMSVFKSNLNGYNLDVFVNILSPNLIEFCTSPVSDEPLPNVLKYIKNYSESLVAVEEKPDVTFKKRILAQQNKNETLIKIIQEINVKLNDLFLVQIEKMKLKVATGL